MKVILVLTLLLLSVTSAGAQGFTIRETRVFTPQSKKIALLKDASNQRKIILFQTKLRVNTDGSPLSYHPGDPRGQTKALNNVCNAIAVRRTNSNSNLCFTSFGQAINVFEQFRDSNFQTVPSGFRITWANVLATVKENGKDVPCVFKSGTFKGYFGSLTALKNGLTTNKGECDVDDQVNPITVPALVLAGGQNPMRTFGARVGDLVIAFNPKTNFFVPAIIGDSGPANNLGEGSILLNMKLLGQTVPPANKAETFRLSIEDAQVMVAIIPGSRTFQTAKPFTVENIKQRVEAWQRESGFSTPESFVAFIKSLEPQIR